MYYQPERNDMIERAVIDVGIELGPRLRKTQYAHMKNPLGGMCYVLSEALYHLVPNRYKPMNVRVDGDSHWYLIDVRSGAIVDLTWSQFAESTVVPYENGVGRGFLTKQPSRRAQAVMDQVRRRNERNNDRRHEYPAHRAERDERVYLGQA